MNKRLLPLGGLIAIVLIAFSFSACSVNKDFSFAIEKQFVVTGYNSLTYSSIDTVNARQSSSDFDKYKGDISSLDISSATYTITYFSGPSSQKITSGTLSVGDVNGSAPKVIATVSDISLGSIMGTAQPLTLTADGKQYFKDLLMGGSSSALLYFTATTNQTPITFTVLFHFNLSATYSKSII